MAFVSDREELFGICVSVFMLLSFVEGGKELLYPLFWISFKMKDGTELISLL